MEDLKESASNDNSKTSTEEDDEDEDVEPVLAYYRMRNGVLDVLNKDFASCMRVNSKVLPKREVALLRIYCFI
jgi:hypothetical protein